MRKREYKKKNNRKIKKKKIPKKSYPIVIQTKNEIDFLLFSFS